jgi:4-hydroxythreonine-4-phosphate dehydrogenase
MTLTRPPVSLTMGDPAGCGPAITAAAWRILRDEPQAAFAVHAPASVLSPFAPVIEVAHPGEIAEAFRAALPVIPLQTALPPPTPGQPDPAAAPAIIASIEAAMAAAQTKAASAIVTNPISKSLLYKAGFTHPGHTEFLAQLCGGDDRPAPRPVMMLTGGGLRVALATIHMSLRDAIEAIDGADLQAIARITDLALRRDFNLPAPRLAFTGLNPHAGEDGAIGREETDIINPAARALRGAGIDICDARPADTVFAEALDGRFDAVIAMTHDQGLIPVKTLDFWGGVNTTLGLPVIRTSPDHGTAYDAAREGTARADSLVAAIRLAHHLAENRRQSDRT